MRESEQYSTSDLSALFSVSRPTVYRTLSRVKKIHNSNNQRLSPAIKPEIAH